MQCEANKSVDTLVIKTFSSEVSRFISLYEKFSYTLDFIEEKDNFVILHLKRDKNISHYKQIKKLERAYFNPLKNKLVMLIILTILTFIALSVFIAISFSLKDVYSLDILLLSAGLPALIILLITLGYGIYFALDAKNVENTSRIKKETILKELDNLK